jgi:excisionase family DNA binding protein
METNTVTELLTEDELAAHLRTTPRFVKRICVERRIRYVLIGGRRRFDPADVAAFIEAEKKGGQEAPQRVRPSGRPKNADRRRG